MIARMIDRILSTQLVDAIGHSPAVALLRRVRWASPRGLWGVGCAIEIKRSVAPKVARGSYAACADLKPARKFVVYPGHEHYRLAEDIEAISLVVWHRKFMIDSREKKSKLTPLIALIGSALVPDAS